MGPLGVRVQRIARTVVPLGVQMHVARVAPKRGDIQRAPRAVFELEPARAGFIGARLDERDEPCVARVDRALELFNGELKPGERRTAYSSRAAYSVPLIVTRCANYSRRTRGMSQYDDPRTSA
jgi:hypothetical protein